MRPATTSGRPRWYRQRVVLLGAQPAERIADVHAETPFVGGGVGTGEVDGRAEVDHRAAGRQLGGDDLVIEGLAPTRPPVAAGHHTGRAVVGAEVDERDQRCDLQLVVRAREVRPHVLVAMGDLGFRAGTPRDQVTEVEAIARAGRQQDLVADVPVGVMGHHLVGERRRDCGQRRDVLGAGPEEGLDHRVDGAHPGLGVGDRVGDFGVDRVDGRVGDESVDEDRAVGAEGVGDGRVVGGVGEPGDRSHGLLLRRAGARRWPRARGTATRSPAGCHRRAA